jgi:hypothetical protein
MNNILTVCSLEQEKKKICKLFCYLSFLRWQTAVFCFFKYVLVCPIRLPLFLFNLIASFVTPSSIRRRDLKPQPLTCESSPLTTRPGLSPWQTAV